MSTTAFLRHGVSTTIIEIDPEVYRAARMYFGLPDPGKDRVFLEDARGWVERRAAQTTPQTTFDDSTSSELFDFVVHDCFSGGGVPQHLYTVEFLQQVKSIMTPEGKFVLVRTIACVPLGVCLTCRLELRRHCRLRGDQTGVLHPALAVRAMSGIP